MYDAILYRIHTLVLQGNYVFTDHALLEMDQIGRSLLLRMWKARS